MKSDRRHKLAQNSLANWLKKSVDATKIHAPMITRVVLLILLVIVLFMAWQWFSVKNVAEFNNDVNFMAANGEALTPEIIDGYLVKYPKGESNAYVNMIAGEVYLVRGLAQVETKRSEAIDLLKKASGYFEAADAQHSKKLEVGDRVLWGLAQVHETLAALQTGKDRDRALELFERLRSDWPKSAYAELALDHISLLKRPVTGVFLAEYAKSDIGLKAPEMTTPELNPDFNTTMPEPGTDPLQKVFDAGLGDATLNPGAATPAPTVPESTVHEPPVTVAPETVPQKTDAQQPVPVSLDSELSGPTSPVKEEPVAPAETTSDSK